MVIGPDPDEPDEKVVSFYDDFMSAMQGAEEAGGRLYQVQLLADFEAEGN
jgi:hypothetical protein